MGGLTVVPAPATKSGFGQYLPVATVGYRARWLASGHAMRLVRVPWTRRIRRCVLEYCSAAVVDVVFDGCKWSRSLSAVSQPCAGPGNAHTIVRILKCA
jgi:hypothetical protein